MATLLQQSEKIVTEARLLLILIVGILLIGTIGLTITTTSPITGAFVTTLKMLAGDNVAGIKGAATGIQTFLHLFGAIIIWFAIWTAFGLTIEGKFGEVFKEVRTLSQIKNLSGHYIVCGAGRVGKHIGNQLRKSGELVVFIEKDKDAVVRLRNEGYLVIDVGPIDSHVLAEANIAKAKGIAVSLGDDSKNLLLVLEARELNQEIKIAARVNDSKLVPKFKRAGANYIILPEAIGGIKLAEALRGKVDSTHVFVND